MNIRKSCKFVFRLNEQLRKKPKEIISKMKLTFQVCCFLMAAYWTALFSSQYRENNDAILITMKNFNHDPSDEYPTFSFCIKGTDLHWANEHEIFKAYGINPLQYELMLKGEVAFRYELNHSSELCEKIPVYVNDGINANLSQFHIQVVDIVSDVKFKEEKFGKVLHEYSVNNLKVTIDSRIHLSYQSPEKICFTRNSSDPLNLIRLQDMITFNSTALNTTRYKMAKIQIFIHHPGQLISSFDEPKYESTFSDLLSTLREYSKTPKILDFKISQCKVLRKRHDSKIPCNKKIKIFDKFIKEKIINLLGCIPPFWKNTITKINGKKECTSQEKLKEAYSYLLDFNKILDESDKPCDEMLVQSIDSINYKPVSIPRDISIAFHYTEKLYEEIKYTRAMGFESWLSNVGGFVGIFLGYSIMQIPDMFLHVIRSFLEARNKCFSSF